MKVLVFDASRCTGCHTCEEVCSQTWFKELDREKSAIHILNAGKGGTHRAIVCNQCGDCIDVCPTRALLRARNGVVRMDKTSCVGCLSCVGFCGIWAMHTHCDHIEPFKCVACGRCAKACPENALSIQEVPNPEPSETKKWAERIQTR